MLDFQLSTVIFTIINLLVLYVILKKLLFGRINAVLEQREAMIKDSLASAEASAQQAEADRQEYEEQLNGARQEAAKILSDAQTRAQRLYEAKMASAQADIRQLHAQAEERIATQREEMLRGVRGEVASLALEAAARAAGASMDEAGDRKLVEEFLSEVGEPT